MRHGVLEFRTGCNRIVDQVAFKSIIIKIGLLFQIHVTILFGQWKIEMKAKWARKNGRTQEKTKSAQQKTKTIENGSTYARNHTMKLSF